MEITEKHLVDVVGASTKYTKKIAEALTKLGPKYGVDTPQQVAHFIAQAAHETDRFRTLREYASGAAYEGRTDLGNTLPGDGRRFKGRGIFQTTGRANYRYASVASGDPARFIVEPALLEDPSWAVWSACLYWGTHKLGEIAAQDDEAEVEIKVQGKVKKVSPVEAITRKINGGTNGLAERKAFYEKAKKTFVEGGK